MGVKNEKKDCRQGISCVSVQEFRCLNTQLTGLTSIFVPLKIFLRLFFFEDEGKKDSFFPSETFIKAVFIAPSGPIFFWSTHIHVFGISDSKNMLEKEGEEGESLRKKLHTSGNVLV